jgi:Fe-S-cluster containining protein
LIHVDCTNCRLCCHFQVSTGKWLTKKSLARAVPFAEYWYGVFFIQKNNRYLMQPSCRHYSGNSCTIHEKDILPPACALYPVLVTGNKGSLDIYIDRQCPRYQDIVNQLSNSKYKTALEDYLINCLENGEPVAWKNGSLDSFGYKPQFIYKLITD